MTGGTVALFGGSFDPPHVGHVLAVAYTLAAFDVDAVLVVPVFAHAFDKPLSPFEDRLEMTRLALRDLRRVEVSDVERDLGAPSRTLHTVRHLHARHPGVRFRLVIGADVLHETDRWLGFDELSALAPPLVLGRAGVSHPAAPEAVLPEVSSTELREVLRRTTTPRARDEGLRRLVPHAVLEHVDARGLYR